MNEQKLTEKLKLIEALFAGAATEGEKDAAFNALQRIKNRLPILYRLLYSGT